MYYVIICFLIDKTMHLIRKSFIEHFIVPFLIGCLKYYVHIHLLAFVLNIILLPLCATSISNCNTIRSAMQFTLIISFVWFGLKLFDRAMRSSVLDRFFYFFLGLLLFFSVAPNSCLKWSKKMELHGWTRTETSTDVFCGCTTFKSMTDFGPKLLWYLPGNNLNLECFSFAIKIGMV